MSSRWTEASHGIHALGGIFVPATSGICAVSSPLIHHADRVRGKPAWSGLARYVFAAALARTADGGAVVAIVLLVTMQGGSGSLAGVLAACITLPHLLGPFVARHIDLADDGRRIIAAACGLYAIALTLAVLTFGAVPAAITGLLLAIAGSCGPLQTGGISTRLPSIVAPDQHSQRRAQGWDVATYGIGGTLGPALIAGVAVWASPAFATLCLAAASAVAAGLVMCLPRAPPGHGGDMASVPGTLHTVALMARDGRLRRTLYMTVSVAFGVAVLPIAAIYLAVMFGVHATSAATMTAVYGIGNLIGSMLLMWRPMRGSPDHLMTWLAACVATGLATVLLSQTLAIGILTYGLAGALNAVFFAATLAARTEYAPTEARSQVFLWVAAMKITAGSAGTAFAGVMAVRNVHMALSAAIVVIVLAVVASLLERHFARRPRLR